ncbi:type IV pilus modification protein PilV [Stutzerimonas nitrititolerans]|uniref:type IV pilus modification protein PilV n=1 Tax=Stutzerimonas nitrititolerans TaxID=2482751 RepID=UPI0028A7CFD2|nr:type IV pilus modification protein PilV [Stutzerimonas nitrititolerans]
MPSHSYRKEAGATLIEVLVAMVVLAIGLLGLAGLQTTSIQSNHSAYYRSQATLLAGDLADRMRANRTEALTNAYVIDFPTSSTTNSVTGTSAKKDIAEWLNQLAQTLPEGTGKVEKDGTLVTISVRWNDTRGQIKASKDTKTHNETFAYRTEI